MVTVPECSQDGRSSPGSGWWPWRFMPSGFVSRRSWLAAPVPPWPASFAVSVVLVTRLFLAGDAILGFVPTKERGAQRGSASPTPSVSSPRR
ncbi:MAG: hypothetical protein R2705_04175 [Ilumatobacteraceae bacterium]